MSERDEEFRISTCTGGDVHNIRSLRSALAWKEMYDEWFCVRPGCHSSNHVIEHRAWAALSPEEGTT